MIRVQASTFVFFCRLIRYELFYIDKPGYCSAFKEIGNKYGPFDLSLIPIGAYHPRWFLSPQHVDPEQAVQIHTDVRSKKSLAIHWGTFALGKEVIYKIFYFQVSVSAKLNF